MPRAPGPVPAAAPPAAGAGGHPTFDGTDWSACRDCGLCATRGRIVVYRGTLGAEVLFVGEAPGREEDAAGQPFVGRSGRLLDQWIERLSLPSWCITNLVRCRPPDNRPPARAEQDACGPKLLAFLAASRPKAVVALGRHAHLWLEARGVDHERIHHPAYYLRGLAKWEPDVAALKRRLHNRLQA